MYAFGEFSAVSSMIHVGMNLNLFSLVYKPLLQSTKFLPLRRPRGLVRVVPVVRAIRGASCTATFSNRDRRPRPEFSRTFHQTGMTTPPGRRPMAQGNKVVVTEARHLVLRALTVDRRGVTQRGQ